MKFDNINIEIDTFFMNVSEESVFIGSDYLFNNEYTDSEEFMTDYMEEIEELPSFMVFEEGTYLTLNKSYNNFIDISNDFEIFLNSIDASIDAYKFMEVISNLDSKNLKTDYYIYHKDITD